MLWIMSSPWFPEPMAQPWLDPVHPAGPGIFFGHAVPTWPRHRTASKILQLLPVLLPDVERVGPQGHLRGLRGCTAATVPFDIHSPLRVINPTPNPGGRKAEEPARLRNRGLAPSMIPITSAVLRLALQRWMLSSMVTLIATFSLVAGAGFHWVKTGFLCGLLSRGRRYQWPRI